LDQLDFKLICVDQRSAAEISLGDNDEYQSPVIETPWGDASVLKASGPVLSVICTQGAVNKKTRQCA
ncbi:MAG: hypothetical protein VXA98_06085, partial [Gammaproteobacteria bacterium]